jgi:hypothetical protein
MRNRSAIGFAAHACIGFAAHAWALQPIEMGPPPPTSGFAALLICKNAKKTKHKHKMKLFKHLIKNKKGKLNLYVHLKDLK